MIILERIGKDAIIWTTLNDLNSIDAGGKKPIDRIKADIAAGTDITGHAKYRQILRDHNIITQAELNQWRDRLQIEEHKEIGARV